LKSILLTIIRPLFAAFTYLYFNILRVGWQASVN